MGTGGSAERSDREQGVTERTRMNAVYAISSAPLHLHVCVRMCVSM